MSIHVKVEVLTGRRENFFRPDTHPPDSAERARRNPARKPDRIRRHRPGQGPLKATALDTRHRHLRSAQACEPSHYTVGEDPGDYSGARHELPHPGNRDRPHACRHQPPAASGLTPHCLLEGSPVWFHLNRRCLRTARQFGEADRPRGRPGDGSPSERADALLGSGDAGSPVLHGLSPGTCRTGPSPGCAGQRQALSAGEDGHQTEEPRVFQTEV